MRDKLTKKRIKVDYLLVLKCADLEEEFLSWQQKRKSSISFNRLAYAFCKIKHVDIDRIFGWCLERGIKSYDEYLKECIRLAQDHSWVED